MFRLTACLAMLIVFAAAGTIRAEVIKNISTGYDEVAGGKLANNSPDTDYVIGPGGNGGRVGATPIARSSPLPSRFVADNASEESRWLAVASGAGLEGINVGLGTYFFDTEVDLSGFVPITARLAQLRYAADNKLIGIYVNDTRVWQQSNSFAEEFRGFRGLADQGLSAFGPSLNTIRFEVSNQLTSASPMAFRLEGLVVATPVPEPSTLILLSMGAVGLLVYALRKRR